MGIPPPFFCKYVILGHFKSFVLKVCETKGFADAFLRKYVKRKSLGAMWGLLGICDRSFGSLRSLRTTILVGWSFWPRLRFLGPFFGPSSAVRGLVVRRAAVKFPGWGAGDREEAGAGRWKRVGQGAHGHFAGYILPYWY